MSDFRCYLFVTSVLAILISSPDLFSEDWPNWRHDASRTAATDQVLPDTLHLQWTRQLPAPKAAWPEDTRLMFDAAYEPIVVGHSLFLASAQTDCVTSFDTRSGEEQWRFYTGGPVRFAPVANGGKLYFGCDDGMLYCLNRVPENSIGRSTLPRQVEK